MGNRPQHVVINEATPLLLVNFPWTRAVHCISWNVLYLGHTQCSFLRCRPTRCAPKILIGERQSMRLVTPVCIPAFASVTPSVDMCQAAWGTSFDVGRHIYTMRFEAVELDATNKTVFCREQEIPTFQEKQLHYV